MLRSRIAAFIMFAGVLLVLGTIGLLSSVTADWEQANGSRRLQKLTVNFDRSVASSSSAGLKLQDAELLAKKWSPLPIAYEAKAQARATYGSVSASCSIFGVNGNFRDFAQIRMTAGTSIAPASVNGHSRVAVIGAKLADKLFRSVKVVGKTIELYGVPFTVIGVFDDDGSLIRQMSDDGIPDMLIPVTAMFDVNPDARIDTIQLAAKPDAAIRGEAEAKHALAAAGINPLQYRIVNDVLAHTQVAQLRSLLLFGCGIIAIVLLARLIIRQFAIVRAALQSRLAAHDWSDALSGERYRFLKCGLAAALMAGCAAGLWELIRFRLYIPPEWVPDEIIDVSFYTDKLRMLWQQQAMESGYVPSPHEQLAGAAGKVAAMLFMAGAMLGLPLFLLGARLWAMERVHAIVQLQRLFLFIPAAAVITFAAARWTGTDYRIDPLEYAVTGALFIVTIVYLNEPKGVKLSHVENRS
ncbi:ABC transporter permease [Paenibacillus piri]|uniref:MacB-like periplasmic core domain-containing protein n=1 Tax=Paenibacillus piri TaxID=2547395 RepID=A0A4R5KHF5_9BACL|nr:ABC transporter permease [Paenibacillus piri]TDF94766.1 hypothetical protein E1757_22690 [Paenibacillus piri]